ncbi:MAG: histidine ammonia-lyase [Candidatus Hodarchaeales archaeon]
MRRSTVILDGFSLTIKDLVMIARHNFSVELAEKAIEKIKESANIVNMILENNKRVYGVTTGFGFLQDVTISPEDSKQLQLNLVRSHSVAVGRKFPTEVVRGIMALQINKFARGNSGVQLKTVDILISLLNKGITPIVPSKGSLGASGDLAPLAHLTLVLIGEGEAEYQGNCITGKKALEILGVEPIELMAKEGLALLNGTQAMTSIAALTVFDTEYLIKIADIATALSMEVHRANTDSLNPLIHEARPHPGQIEVASELRSLLEGSRNVRQNIGHQDCYSLRCAPAVHGASLDTLNHVKRVVEIEMNSSTDNPLIFSKDQIFSGGNFHGQPIALTMDFLGIALSELGNISERRVDHLLNPKLSGLPAFLSVNSGLDSGLMIAQYTAASLVSENKILASPASVDSIPVSAGQEDHVSMGTISASHARQILENLEIILSIELIAVCQAVDLADVYQEMSPKLREKFSIIRQKITKIERDRVLATDIYECVELIRKRSL